jgi:hypothetical protein
MVTRLIRHGLGGVAIPVSRDDAKKFGLVAGKLVLLFKEGPFIGIRKITEVTDEIEEYRREDPEAMEGIDEDFENSDPPPKSQSKPPIRTRK